jgi:two-component system, OmpR family, sensor kinase
VTFLAYPQLLRRAIDNVLRNAIRHAPLGSDVLLNCKVDDGLKQVLIEILDCGPGVPDSMLTDIFLSFFSHRSGTREQ